MRNLPEKLAVLGLILILVSALYAAERLIAEPGTVLEEVDEILHQVQEIRNLTFKEWPRIVVITKSEALSMWKPGETDVERLRIEELTYKMTLLLPPDYQYIKEETERKASWIAATVGDTIYIIRENFMENPDIARRTIAHESVHVLQKQWFDAKYRADTYDGTIAVQSLIEGDADLVADLYCERNGIPIHKIRSLSGNPLTDLHIFPYVFGDRFVRYLYEKGSWELVNEAYSRYPVSAQQVMHPELYLENVTPLNVTLSAPPGSRVLKEDRLGAYYVYILLLDVAGLDNEAAWSVSTAWLGDRLVLTVNGTDYVLLWKVEFSDERASETFAETLKKLARENSYAHFTITRDGNTVLLKAVRRVRIET
ncbi:hypothetical protein TEU_01145 [Thermococcus eurythermalis]|uniref:DUF4157 domain-containing protein n=1 Tax=Thermococcus eurythermalis TaxID=1505907 RepID=A0A097QRG6_9EURY|nr:hypothetical protein [Thermococcus eurythermalis]AIU69055.1 hypothetical protein TEU_01145 [Thermococcus eurythermalis]